MSHDSRLPGCREVSEPNRSHVEAEQNVLVWIEGDLRVYSAKRQLAQKVQRSICADDDRVTRMNVLTILLVIDLPEFLQVICEAMNHGGSGWIRTSYCSRFQGLLRVGVHDELLYQSCGSMGQRGGFEPQLAT